MRATDCPVLVVASDQISRDLTRVLSKTEFRPCSFDPESSGDLLELEQGVKLILIDEASMPLVKRMELLTRLRERSTLPILVIQRQNGRNHDPDYERTIYLEMGADMAEFCPGKSEMVERLRALWRRNYCFSRRSAEREVIDKGDLRVFIEEHRVLVAGEEVHFEPKEYGVLLLLARRFNKKVTKEELADEIWQGDLKPESHNIVLYVSKVRRKINSPGCPNILSVPCYGWRMTMDSEPNR